MKQERGYVMVLMSVSLVILTGYLALSVDLGHVYISRSQLQNAADSAALASVVDIPQGLTDSYTVPQQSALDFGQTHTVAASGILINTTDVQFGIYDALTKNFAEAAPNPNPPGSPSPLAAGTNAVRVTARRTTNSLSGPLQLFFAAILGQNTADVQASSTAYLDQQIVGVTGLNRLIPYSIDEDFVDQNGDGVFDVGTTINVFPGSHYVTGNFGFLDLDGGSNSNEDTKEWIEEGYYTDFTIPPGGSVNIHGDTGISGNSLLNSFNLIEGAVVFFPIHTTVVNPGNNAIFTVTSFCAGRITDVQLTGSLSGRHINVEIIYYASSVLVTDPNAPINPTLAKPRLVA